MAYIGRDTDKISNVEVLDNITFDGSSSYTLQKGGSNFTPSSANTLLLSIDGVVQAGNFTVSGSTIDFGTAVAGTSTCDFILHYGVGLITTPSDGTVTTAKLADSSVTTAKLASGAVQNQSAFKNIIINGDMSIAQRGTSASSLTGSSYETVDRFKQEMTSGGTWTQSQSTDVPTGQGFAKSLKMDCTSTGSGGYLHITQRFEGQNLQYLKKGTSSAESLTLSFWVKSAKTGTYIAEFRDIDNTRNISKSYSISSADTWEKKTITFPGDTSGAFGNDNGSSLELNLWLAAGSGNTSGTLQTNWGSQVAANRAVGQVNLGDSTSNDWYITGIQLEAGTSASDFEFLPYDVNFNRCLRYFFTFGKDPAGNNYNKESNIGSYYTSTAFIFNNFLPEIMRASPSTSFISDGGNAIEVYSAGSGRNSSNVSLDSTSPSQVAIAVTTSSATAGHVGSANWQSGDYVQLSAEL